jgi:AraC-like DNA-binding protein
MYERFTLDWRSALLGLCVLQIAVIAMAVLRRAGASSADRWLAGFLLALAGVLTPYAIGYSGAYVFWPDLTFLPVALPLALGPALFGYVYARALGNSVPRPFMHLMPPGLQLMYYAAAFALPSDAKQAWVTGGHSAVLAPALEIAVLVSFAVYAVLIARTLVARDAQLRASDSRWLWRVLAAFGLVCVVKLVFDLWAVFVRPADYDAQTLMYLIFATSGLFLAIEGWRRAGDAIRPRAGARKAVSPTALGKVYAERIRTSGWWREPDLTVPVLARRLGASESSLARAFNASMGCGVAHYLNTLRADAVADALRSGSRDDLLHLAFAYGFSSKSSFNRVFQARFGRTPSDFRREVSVSGFVDA